MDINNLEISAELCEMVDVPLAKKLTRLVIQYDEAAWVRLRSGAMTHMLGQARLLARITGLLNGRQPALAKLYWAALVNDGRAFSTGFRQLFLTWESTVVDVDSKHTMPENSA